MAMLVFLFPLTRANAANSGNFGEELTWEVDDEGNLTICGTGDMPSIDYPGPGPWGNAITTVTIEEGITSISQYAFYGCTGLTSVTIPNSVNSIGFYAFADCTSLTGVYIDDLTAWCEIQFGINNGSPTGGINANPLVCGHNLYLHGELLTELVIPDGITSLGNNAFDGGSCLTNVTIPGSVTSIGSYAFNGCTGLTAVTIPGSVTSIGAFVFSGCTGITSVTISDSVTSMGIYILSGCSSLESLTIPFINYPIGRYFDDSEYSGSIAVTQNGTTYHIPASLRSVSVNGGSFPKYAFQNCTFLMDITIGNSVASIGSYAFQNCAGLTDITIPDSVSSIGSYAFDRCSSLESLSLPVVSGPIGVYFSTSEYNGLTYILQSGTPYFLPSTLRSITVTGTSIGSYAFQNCTFLTDITIGNSVASIGSYAFQNCTGLTEIAVPECVTSIGGFAFSGCTTLTGVYIHDLAAWCGISFGSDNTNPLLYAHHLYINGERLRQLVFPSGLTVVKGHVFSGCTDLTEVVIPDGVTSIEGYAFSGCTDLTEVVIPDGVTSIGRYAFSGCTGLSGIDIPESITNIGSYAFNNCSGLRIITVPDSVADIGSCAFSRCGSLESLTLPFIDSPIGSYFGTSTYSGATYFKQNNTTYSIPASLHSITVTGGEIGTYAFQNLSILTDITLADGVTAIGSYAFNGCTGLTSITIPGSISSIGSNAFSGCPEIAWAHFLGNETTWTSVGGTNCGLTEDQLFFGDLSSGICGDSLSYVFDLDTGLLTISGNGAMTDYASAAPWATFGIALKAVSLPDGLTSVGSRAFRLCTGLEHIYLGANVTVMGEDVFLDCPLLKTAGPGSGDYDIEFSWKKTIPANAFSGANSLTSVTLPASLIKLGDKAFFGCAALEHLQIPNTLETIGDQIIAGCTALDSLGEIGSNCKLEIPWVERYLNVFLKNNSNLKRIVVPETVTSLGKGIFSGCSSLESLVLPAVSDIIGPYFGTTKYSSSYSVSQSGSQSSGTYYLPNSLRSVTVTGGRIANYAFSNCTGLTDIILSDSVTGIGDYAFSRCSGLTDITVGSSVASIGSYAFKDCSSLTSVRINDLAAWCNIRFVGIDSTPLNFAQNLYLSGARVTDMVIPNGISSISDGAFYGYTGLTSVIIPGSVRTIGSSAFGGCSSLIRVTIANGVTSVGSYAFSGCSSLTGIVFPDSVTSIGGCAFEYCTLLESFTVPSKVTEIGAATFFGCTALESVVLPAGLRIIDNRAFYGCTSLSHILLPDGLTGLGFESFSSCSSLESVTIPGCTGAVESVFRSCTGLKTVYISNGATSLSSYAFEGCTNLQAIYIPRSVTSIGEKAFYDCERLNDVYYSGSAADWANITIGDSNGFLTSADFHYGKSPLGEVKAEVFSIVRKTAGETTTYEASVFCKSGTAASAYAVRYGADGRLLSVTALKLVPGDENLLTVSGGSGVLIRIFIIADGTFIPLTTPVNIAA